MKLKSSLLLVVAAFRGCGTIFVQEDRAVLKGTRFHQPHGHQAHKKKDQAHRKKAHHTPHDVYEWTDMEDEELPLDEFGNKEDWDKQERNDNESDWQPAVNMTRKEVGGKNRNRTASGAAKTEKHLGSNCQCDWAKSPERCSPKENDKSHCFVVCCKRGNVSHSKAQTTTSGKTIHQHTKRGIAESPAENVSENSPKNVVESPAGNVSENSSKNVVESPAENVSENSSKNVVESRAETESENKARNVIRLESAIEHAAKSAAVSATIARTAAETAARFAAKAEHAIKAAIEIGHRRTKLDGDDTLAVVLANAAAAENTVAEEAQVATKAAKAAQREAAKSVQLTTLIDTNNASGNALMSDNGKVN